MKKDKNKLKKLKEARDRWLKQYHNVELYDYQKEPSDSIIEAVFFNRGEEIAIEFSRQSGKTTDIVHTVEYLIFMYKIIFKKGLRIGIFAPQKEQAKTDFDRLKTAFNELINKHNAPLDFSERNATTLRPDFEVEGEVNPATLDFGGETEVYIFPVSKTSHPESKTLDLMIFEEAQNIDDHTAKNDIFPMGAATNASRVFIGTAGYNICYFYRLLQKEGIKKYIIDYKKVIEEKRKMYDKTGDPEHLNYQRAVEKEKLALGEDSDEFRAPYKLEWILGTGQFCTREMFDPLVRDSGRIHNNKKMDCYAGIDTAKDPDSTVITFLGYDKETKKKHLLNWVELKGDNYQDQFDIIWDKIKESYNVRAVAIDSTGQGDFMPDMFERHTYFTSEESGLFRVKFSLPMKDIIYKNLLVQIKESLTSIPKIDTNEAERFKQQMLDLQKEYKGNLLSCHHPNDPYARDDYCDSWALAEYAFYKYNETQPEMTIIDPTGKQQNIEELQKRKPSKKTKITDYWPGQDEWEL